LPQSRAELWETTLKFEGEGRGGVIQKSMRKVKTEIASVVTELQYLFHPPLVGAPTGKRDFQTYAQV